MIVWMVTAEVSPSVKRFSSSLQLYPYTEEAEVLIRAKRQTNLVASLADVAWIEGDEEDEEDEEDDEGYFGRSR